MIITREEFCELIRALKKCTNLNFVFCDILSTSPCDFGDMSGCRISKIMFAASGSTVGWEEDFGPLENIISGISKSTHFRDTLQSIEILDCKLSYEEQEAIFKKYKILKFK